MPTRRRDQTFAAADVVRGGILLLTVRPRRPGAGSAQKITLQTTTGALSRGAGRKGPPVSTWDGEVRKLPGASRRTGGRVQGEEGGAAGSKGVEVTIPATNGARGQGPEAPVTAAPGAPAAEEGGSVEVEMESAVARRRWRSRGPGGADSLFSFVFFWVRRVIFLLSFSFVFGRRGGVPL